MASKLKYETARFSGAYGTPEQLPEPTTPEVSFVGRSNVGKSSLLNKLLGRKALAHVSGQPGKTANINFYDVDGVMFVDLPGYGFAKVSHAEKRRWSKLIAGYFDQRRSFNLVVALIDIRHDAQDIDQETLAFLTQAELPFVVALTKADKLSRARQRPSPDSSTSTARAWSSRQPRRARAYASCAVSSRPPACRARASDNRAGSAQSSSTRPQLNHTQRDVSPSGVTTVSVPCASRKNAATLSGSRDDIQSALGLPSLHW